MKIPRSGSIGDGNPTIFKLKLMLLTGQALCYLVHAYFLHALDFIRHLQNTSVMLYSLKAGPWVLDFEAWLLYNSLSYWGQPQDRSWKERVRQLMKEEKSLLSRERAWHVWRDYMPQQKMIVQKPMAGGKLAKPQCRLAFYLPSSAKVAF